jgi:ankyrin repeat protein/DNA polymerase III delta prime subunit
LLDQDEHLELLRWLSSCPFTRHQEALSEARMPNSAVWLQVHPEYRNWKSSSSSSILLLHGIPGSGKSTICSAVVDSLLGERAANHLAAPAAYFYCADCQFEPERSQSAELMRSILRQLTITSSSQPLVSGIILSEFQRRLAQSRVDGMEMRKLTVQDCTRLILEVTATDSVTIVIDALDEIKEHDRPVLINALQDIVVGSPSVVKVFLTSRNNSHIFSLLREVNEQASPVSSQIDRTIYVKTVEVDRDLTLEDIQKFVRLRFAQVVKDRRLLKRDPTPELSELLIEKLVAGAGEMFQWVNIQIEHLCQHDREEDIMTSLQDETLATLDSTYSLVLERILRKGNSSPDIAIRAFSWLLYMREAVSTEYFVAAVSTSMDTGKNNDNCEELMAICSGLLLLDSKNNTFRFSHYSVQEFLRTQPLFSPALAHAVLATRCLTICTAGPSIGLGMDPPELDMLYRYSALYWAYHCSVVIKMKGNGISSNDIKMFVYDGPGDVSLSFMGWLDFVGKFSKNLEDHHPMKMVMEAMSNPDASPLFLASAFGLDCLLTDIDLGGDAIDWNQKNDHGHTGLYLACASGNLSTAQILLAQGADPNIGCGKFGNALQAACFFGHGPLVRLLFEHITIPGAGAFKNAFEACVRGNNEDVAMILLEYDGIMINEEEFDLAIGAAAQAGFPDVIERLTRSALGSQYGSNRPSKMKIKTAKAIKGGQAGILAQFLKCKSDIEGLLPEGPIAIAALYGHQQIIELLACLKIDLEGECNLGSPLRCAALMGHERIVRQLIELGADVNGCGRYGAALQAASMKGHTRIAKLLLRSGANVNQEGGAYGTALQAAAYHGHNDAVELLLNTGAKVHIVGSSGISRDAFHAAAEGGHYDILKLMLDKGFMFYEPPPPPMLSRMPSPPYKSLLRSNSPSQEVEERVRGRNRGQAPVNMSIEPDQSYQHLFCLMEESGHQGADDRAAVSRGSQRPQLLQNRLYGEENYALEASAATGRLQIVAMLLERKSALVIKDDEVLNALNAAAAYGHFDVFSLIFDELRPPLPVSKLLKALETAATHGNMSILGFGIEKMTTINWTYEGLRTLVKLACHATQVAVEKALTIVAENATKENVKKLMGLALLSASANGHADIVSYLLQRAVGIKKKSVHEAFRSASLSGHTSVVSVLLQVADKRLAEVLLSDGLTISWTKGHFDLFAYLADSLSQMGKETVTAGPLAAAQDWRFNTTNDSSGRQKAWKNHILDLNSALITASFKGHGDLVKALLTAGVDVNFIVSGPDSDPPKRTKKRRFGRWPKSGLSGAMDGKLNALQAALAGLAQLRIDGNTIDPQDGSLLGRERVVKMLLDHGADSNALGGREVYPIITAAEHCSEQVVGWLIESGADVNATIEGRNAVLAAAGRELLSARVMRRLIEAGARVQSDVSIISHLFNSCLKYFEGDGQFFHTETLDYVFREGPGAVAKILFAVLPSEKPNHKNVPGLLQSAIAAGDHTCVDLLLQRGAKVNSTGSYYGTALQAAAYFGRTELVRSLLAAGAKPNILQGRHGSALRAAVVGGHAATVKLLLQHGADIYIGVSSKRASTDQMLSAPLLNLAAESGNANIIHLLLNKEAKMKLQVRDYETPLWLAVRSGNAESVRLLLETGVGVKYVSSGSRTELSVAVKHGQTGVTSRLTTSTAVIYDSKIWRKYLRSACSARAPKVVELLLELVVDTENQRQVILEAMEIAAGQHDGEIVRLLSEYVDQSIEVFHKASIAGSLPLINIMIDRGISVNGEDEIGAQALDLAAYNLQVEAVKVLVERGAKLDHNHPTFGTALSAAIYGCIEHVLPCEIRPAKYEEEFAWFDIAFGPPKPDMGQISRCEDIIQFLVDHGAAIETAPRDFGFVLHLACFLGSMAIINTLLSAGADINGEAGYFKIPLFAAIYRNNLEAVRLLLREGSEVDYYHPQFGTPLFFACQANRPQIAYTILEFGGDPNVLGPDGGSSISKVFEMDSTTFSDCDLSDQEWLLREFLKSSRGLKLRGGDLVKAAEARSNDYSPLEEFLKFDQNIVVPEEAVIAALTADCTKRLGLLLARIRDNRVTETMMVKARSRNAVLMLLQHDTDFKITQDMVQIMLAARKSLPLTDNRHLMLDVLLDNSPDIAITEPIFLAAFGHLNPYMHSEWRQELVRVLQKHNKKLTYTEEMSRVVNESFQEYPDPAMKELFYSLADANLSVIVS